MNERLQGNNLTFFQTDFDINDDPSAPSPGPNITITDENLKHLDETGTDAMVYWTVYPKGGLEGIGSNILDDLTNRISFAIQSGRSVFIRFAPEMNGGCSSYAKCHYSRDFSNVADGILCRKLVPVRPTARTFQKHMAPCGPSCSFQVGSQC
jgi:hypothetical protein